MSRPLIGITAYFEAARWSDYVRDAVLSPPSYARAVGRAGRAPVVLPPIGTPAIEDYISGVQGIVLAGGVELGAGNCGGEPDERVAEPQQHRDRFELALARAAVRADLPILAIARG